MIRLAVTAIAALFSWACDTASAPIRATEATPRRIVSLDFCADQYVLKLADRESILAVSRDATKDFSFMREEALGRASRSRTGRRRSSSKTRSRCSVIWRRPKRYRFF